MQTDRGWAPTPAGLAADASLRAAVVGAHRGILQRSLAGDPMLNPGLDIEVRAMRRIEGWRAMLLLTPWMLARLLFPDAPPPLAIPAGWSQDEREGADYQVLGPRIAFELLGQPQQAHLSYQPGLGHYLLQPICLNMAPYPDADTVFAAWGEVIRTRDENMERARRDCPLQREVSRRELLRLGRGNGE